jgi:hypothetical protein
MEQDKGIYKTYRKGEKRSPASPACSSPLSRWPSGWASSVENGLEGSQGVGDRPLNSYCDVNIDAARAELRHRLTLSLSGVENASP